MKSHDENRLSWAENNIRELLGRVASLELRLMGSPEPKKKTAKEWMDEVIDEHMRNCGVSVPCKLAVTSRLFGELYGLLLSPASKATYRSYPVEAMLKDGVEPPVCVVYR
jgi:hypothetical protein